VRGNLTVPFLMYRADTRSRARLSFIGWKAKCVAFKLVIKALCQALLQFGDGDEWVSSPLVPYSAPDFLF
jgi:hypothetical protein